jgi:hypothetical protein
MNDRYTKVHYNFETLPALKSPRHELGLTGVALGLIRLPAGEGYTFTHSHDRQEEVYLVIEGKGEMVIDGEIVPLERGDTVRVSPSAHRALHAAGDALLVVCAGGIPMGYPKEPGARYLIDDGIPHYNEVPPWYAGNEEVVSKNRKLQERMERSRKRREERSKSE